MDVAALQQMGRKVLEIERDALSALLPRINEDFARACQIMLGCTGRIVVTGMGKSGHIGGKIAATLASTGTPSFFVHPGEASHGDLGMITKQDVVLAMSNSGETAEVVTILPLIKRMGAPLIAMTGKPSSTLAKLADVHLDVSVAQEACPLNLAPTASTTATLAMGDALAVALLEARGFTPEDFAMSHPGGSLGKALIRVGDLMHTGEDMPLVGEDASMQQVVLTMATRRFGCVGITDKKGALAGIITDGDLARHMDRDLLDRKPLDVMTRNPKVIAADRLAAEALALMNEKKITQLFVLDTSRHPQGILHMHDCLRAGVG